MIRLSWIRTISKVSQPRQLQQKGISSGRMLLQLQGVVYNIIYPMLMKKTVWLQFLAGSGRLVQAKKKTGLRCICRTR